MLEHNFMVDKNNNDNFCLKYFMASFGKTIFWIQMFYSFKYGDKSTSVYSLS